jgi:tRNA(His) guanylyltransferase
MAKSKFEYVKGFEKMEKLLNNTFIVVRVDGHSFHKFSAAHQFQKPNDLRSIQLMTASAQAVMLEFDQIILAYGQSDEYSFVFKRNATLYQRREAKLISNICSLFTSYYVMHWNEFFPNVDLQYPPSFDGRAVCYPTFQNLRDYLSWRQADCHINNLVILRNPV